MKTSLVSAVAISVLLAAPAFADGYGCHSDPHTQTNLGHKKVGVADPNLMHSRGGVPIGTTHTHEVNGVMLRHTHTTQLKTRTTVVDKWNDRLAAKEARWTRENMGAGFGPYSVAEWNARAAAGQPGVVPWQEPWPKKRRWYKGQ